MVEKKIRCSSKTLSERRCKKISKNKTCHLHSSESKKDIWGKFGSVYSPKRKHYVRLGSPQSFNVIKNELVRDKEWYKRVKFMIKRKSEFSNKLKTLL